MSSVKKKGKIVPHQSGINLAFKTYYGGKKIVSKSMSGISTPLCKICSQYLNTFPPTITSCVLSSKVAFMPVWAAAVVIMLAIE